MTSSSTLNTKRAGLMAMALALVATTAAVIAPGAAGASSTRVAAPAATPAPTPTVTGEACAGDEGVTVVVDFTALDDGVAIGCAAGEQPDGYAALEAAGFTANQGDAPSGTVCTIDGRPTQGYPYCWTKGGFWSSWNAPDPASSWAFATTGAGDGPIPAGSVQGWSWAQDFEEASPRVDPEALDAYAPVTTSEVASGTGWLLGELAADDDGVFDRPASESNDYGLTADALLALHAAGRAGDPRAAEARDALADQVEVYATFGEDPQFPDARLAGPLAKLLLVARTAGLDNFGSLDLETELRATMSDSGRFRDQNAGGDTSNGFTQAYAVLALDRTDGGVPPAAVDFLADQQCPDGGFRLLYGGGATCDDATETDTDATALSVQALLALPHPELGAGPDLNEALVRAMTWLLGNQRPGGSFGGTGPTASPNTNSTGLAGTSLAGLGQRGPGLAAAAWVRAQQLSCATGCSGDAGAIAYDPAAKAAAEQDGISSDNRRDQFRRATSQALFALGLPPLGGIGGGDDAVPPGRSAAQSFVTAAHRDFLDRWPAVPELVLRSASLDGGASRAAVARDLANSPEWVRTIVNRFYDDTLGRPPDPGGVAYWVDEIRSGRRTVARVAANFYSSAEYYKTIGGDTDPTWVTDLYDKLLDRSPDADGRAYWVGQTRTRGRTSVALRFFQSEESRRDRVSRLYQDLLGRSPDGAGRAYWAGRIEDEGDIALAVNLAGSAEYASRARARFP